MSTVDFQILGPPSVRHEGAVLELGGPRHRRLLAVLLVNADQVVPTGRLVEALWGEDPPSSAGAMVHVRVSELRSVLRAGRAGRDAGLVNETGGYALRLGDDELDSRRFEDLAAAGLAALVRGDAITARAQLDAGLALWRGPALGEFGDEAFARDAVARLEELRLQAREGRLQAELDLGRHAVVVGELEAAVREHPLREPFWGQLMLALYRCGRQGEALAAYRRARACLADQLGIDAGPQLQALHRAILTQEPALVLPGVVPPPGGRAADRVGAPPGNMPTPLTSFVGRAQEVADVVSSVRRGRLVSVTGVGGVGKSRLAIQAGRVCSRDFAGGAWLVELAAVHQPGLVARVVAATLGVREQGQRDTMSRLADHLADAATLLVFDNCEHLVAEVADVVDRLLSACPRLHVLATTRERMGITGEALHPLAGLAVSSPDLTEPMAIERFDAVRLFVDRARAARPDFALTPSNAGPVAEVCRQLDGLPLAIELAAARINALGVDDIAARLDDRFRLLGRGERTALPRHQTLRAVVDWSFDLLGPAEQRLFAQLSVFVGGFTLGAAEAVGGHEALADELVLLVDKSLVAMTEPGPGDQRYAMLETMRAYGQERLAEAGLGSELGHRHAAYYLDLVRSARPALLGPGQAALLRQFEAELGNIRAALAWFVRQDQAAPALRLAGWLYPLWDRHGHYREGRQWLARALALDAPAAGTARARALDSAAGLALIQGDHETAATEAAGAAALSRQAGDRAGLAQARTTQGLAAVYADDIDRAIELLTEARSIAVEVGDRHAEGSSMLYLMTAHLARGEPDHTRQLGDECELLLDRLGDPEGLAWTRVLRGAAAWRQGDLVAANRVLRPGVLGFADLGHVVGLSVGIYVRAQLTAGTNWDDAVVLLAASEALRESVGAALLPFARPWLDELMAHAVAAIGDAAVQRLWRAGASYPASAAVERALKA